MKNTKLTSFIVLVTLLVAFAGCASTPDAPAPRWMTEGVTVVYPRDQFLAQRGTGSSAEEARNRALQTLAQYINMTVEANLSTRMADIAIDDGKKQTGKSVTEVVNEITTTSNLDMSGVEYTEPYYSKASKEYYVVAYLDKEQAYERLKPTLEREKKRFYSFFDQAEYLFGTEPLLAARYYNMALEEGKSFIGQLEYVRLFNQKAVDKDYAKDEAVIEMIPKYLADTAISSAFYIDVKNDYNNMVLNELISLFAEAGYNTVNSKGAAAYIVSVDIDQNYIAPADDDAPATMTPGIRLTIAGKGNTKASDALFSYSAQCQKFTAYSFSVLGKKAYTNLVDILHEELISSFTDTLGEK